MQWRAGKPKFGVRDVVEEKVGGGRGSGRGKGRRGG